MKDYQRATINILIEAINYALKDNATRVLFMASARSRGETIETIAAQIAHGIHEVAVSEKHTHDLGSSDAADVHITMHYSAITYLICDLLRDENRELISAIGNGKVRAQDVAKLREKICPSIMSAERREYEHRKNQKIEQKVSHAFVCKKCGARDTLMQEVQTRSSDEAPTLVLQCVGCGYRWIQSK